MSEVLIKIAPNIASRLNDTWIAILSGMLVGQEGDVIRSMQNVGLKVVEKFYDGRWVSFIVKR